MKKDYYKMAVLGVSLLTLGLSGCGSETKVDDTGTGIVSSSEAALQESVPSEPVLPDAASTEVASPASEDEGSDWKTAYAELVSDWNEEHGEGAEVGYGMVFINDDDIPELTLFCDDDAWYAMDMYTFVDGSAQKMVLEGEPEDSESLYFSPGFQGKGDQYFEGKGIYLQSRGMMGDSRTYGYRMNGIVFERIFFFDFTDLSWDESIADPCSYILEYTDSNGKDVSVEKTLGEDDDYYDLEGIPEAGDLEKEFGFSFADIKDMSGERISYEEIMEKLSSVE